MRGSVLLAVLGVFVLSACGGSDRYSRDYRDDGHGSAHPTPAPKAQPTPASDDLAQYFEVAAHPEGRDMVIAMFKKQLSSDRDDTWAAVLLGGFEVAGRQATGKDQLVVGISYDNGTTEAYTVAAQDFNDLKAGRITKEQFVDKIRKLTL